MKIKTKEALEGVVFILIAILFFSVPHIISYHPKSIAGNFIVSNNPDGGDPLLGKTVVFVTEHDKREAIGYVINVAIETVKAKDLYDRLGITPSGRKAEIFIKNAYAEKFVNDDLEVSIPVYWGGLVDKNVTNIIVSKKDKRKDRRTIKGTTAEVTDNVHILNGFIPSTDRTPKYKIVLGKLRWGLNQLDREIVNNMWEVIPYDHDILFDDDVGTLWDRLYNEDEE